MQEGGFHLSLFACKEEGFASALLFIARFQRMKRLAATCLPPPCLQKAADIGAAHVVIKGDSNLVVQQMTGEIKV
jgi:hypothetical protein